MQRSLKAAARHRERLMKIGLMARMIAVFSLLWMKTEWHALDRRHLIFRAVGHAALRHPEVMKAGRDRPRLKDPFNLLAAFFPHMLDHFLFFKYPDGEVLFSPYPSGSGFLWTQFKII